MNPYENALSLLFGRINYERNQPSTGNHYAFKLERMQRLLDEIGNPQEKIPAVHIAGTKGKGSTAIMIASVLQQAGYKTGLFTSPHLSRFEERMQVNGQLPDAETFAALFTYLWPHVQKLDQLGLEWAPTFFEITTAIAWLYFQQQKVDLVVLEVGLGGRLDATNVCQPVVTLITNISYDHTNILGHQLTQIAAEKAGIIKPGVPVITAAEQPEVQQVILEQAKRYDCKTYLLGTDFHLKTIEPHPEDEDLLLAPVWHAEVETAQSRWDNVRVPLPGSHQAINTALTLQCIDLLETIGYRGVRAAVTVGFSQVRWPLRCEVLSQRPRVIVDVAHNLASVVACLNTIMQFKTTGKKILIFAATREKEVSRMLESLLPHFQAVILTTYLTNPRAVPVCELEAYAIRLQCENYLVAADPATAWQWAQALASAVDLVCVTGSFFLAAEMRELIRDELSRKPACEPVIQHVPVMTETK